MFGVALRLLTSKAAGPIAAILALAAALFAGAQSIHLADAHRETAKAQAETQLVRLSITQPDIGWAAKLASCSAALDAQGTAITTAATEAQAKADSAAGALLTARSEADRLRAAAASLRNARPEGQGLAQWESADKTVVGVLK